MKKFIVALTLGFCFLLTGSSSATADVLCTDDIIIGLPVEVCVNVPGADPSPVPVPPEVPSIPTQPAPQQPEVPVVPPQAPAAPAEPQAPDAPATEPTPSTTPSETPSVEPAPEDEAQSRLEEQLFPFLLGGVLLLIIFFSSKLVEDFRAHRAKTLDRGE